MKKNLFILAFMSLLFVCCTDSKDKLSSGKVEDLVEEQLDERNMLQAYSVIQTGYYEVDNEYTRRTLRELKAAGVIDYSVQRYAWYNKETSTRRVFSHKKPVYYYGYYLYSEDVYTTKTVTDYDLEEHFLVHVSITEKGKKEQVDSIPQAKSIEDLEDKDLKPLEVNLQDYPEYNVEDEKWPEISYPGKPVAKKDAKSSSNSTTKKKENKEDPYAAIGVNSIDQKTVKLYKAELKKIKTTDVYVKTVKIGISDARRIQISNSAGVTSATAQVIAKIKKSNDFGRIMHGIYEDSKFTFPVDLVFYEDKGWQLDGDIKLNKASEPLIKFVNGKNSEAASASDIECVDSIVADTVALY